jgi:hypothetical protein
LTNTKTDDDLWVDGETGQKLTLPIDALVPYPKNAKKHTPQQIEQLGKSITEFGWTTRILVDENNTIVNGHGRWMAACELGLKEVPVIRRKDLTEDQIRKLRLIDNRVSDTGYDQELLKAELGELANIEDLGLADFFSEEEMHFAMDDIEIDMDALTDDIKDEVDALTGATQDRIDAEDNTVVPLLKVLGFSKVTTSQGRRIKALLAHAEQLTGKDGGAALSEFVADHMGL